VNKPVGGAVDADFFRGPQYSQITWAPAGISAGNVWGDPERELVVVSRWSDNAGALLADVSSAITR
jgi:hypothetical protein